MTLSRFFHLMIIAMALVVTSCSPIERWTVINRQTAKVFHQGNYTRAIDLAHEALAMARTHFAKDQHYVSIALNNLIFLHTVTGRYQKAEILLYQILTLKEMELGPTHPQVSLLLLRLSEVFRFEGNYASAAYYGSRAATLLEQQFPPNHPLTIEALTNLAFVYEAQFDYDLAEKLFLRLLRIQEEELGTHHPDLKPYLINLEKIYRYQGHYDKAITLSKRVLSLTAPSQPLYSELDYSQALTNLANLYFDNKQYDESKTLCLELIEFDQKHRGKTDTQVAMSLDLLGQIYIAQKHYTEAEPLLRRAWAIQEAKLPQNHPQRQKVFAHYTHLLTLLNKPAAVSLLKNGQ